MAAQAKMVASLIRDLRPVNHPTPTEFVRNRLSWLLYLMLAFYAYTQASLGPVMPFLGDELKLSYTVRGLHFSAFALGMVTAGLSADRVARVLGRRRLFWIGGLGMVVGALMLILSNRVELTIASCLLMGALGGHNPLDVDGVVEFPENAAPRLDLDAEDALAVFDEAELFQPLHLFQRSGRPRGVAGQRVGSVGVEAYMMIHWRIFRMNRGD
jgi:MFS family permease